jgi:hypothetical protein
MYKNVFPNHLSSQPSHGMTFLPSWINNPKSDKKFLIGYSFMMKAQSKNTSYSSTCLSDKKLKKALNLWLSWNWLLSDNKSSVLSKSIMKNSFWSTSVKMDSNKSIDSWKKTPKWTFNYTPILKSKTKAKCPTFHKFSFLISRVKNQPTSRNQWNTNLKN